MGIEVFPGIYFVVVLAIAAIYCLTRFYKLKKNR